MAFKVGLRERNVGGIKQAAHAVQALPTKIGKNSAEAAGRNMGTLVRTAEAIFKSSIERPGETGVRKGIRETGSFTFGTDAGGDFTGSTFNADGLIGFGWPDIEKADDRSNFVWRSLEFGLAGTRANSEGVLHGPGFSRFPENQHLVPQGFHRMPRKFLFTTDNPRTSYLKQDNNVPSRLPPGGAGIKGKHFIEDAFTQSLEIMAGRYVKSVLDPVAAFGK